MKHPWIQAIWTGIFLLQQCTALNVTDLRKRSDNHNFGRECDFSDGYYVSWDDTRTAIQKWCSLHVDQVIEQGKVLDDGAISGYKSGIWKVELYVKYQNDHVAYWPVDEDDCNWYLLYIAQGCTKGGDRPTDSKKQVTDGGTFYAPNMGSIDMKWKWDR